MLLLRLWEAIHGANCPLAALIAENRQFRSVCVPDQNEYYGFKVKTMLTTPAPTFSQREECIGRLWCVLTGDEELGPPQVYPTALVAWSL